MISHKIQMILLSLEVNLFNLTECLSKFQFLCDNLIMHVFTHFDNIIKEMLSNKNHLCLLDFLNRQPIVYTCSLFFSRFWSAIYFLASQVQIDIFFIAALLLKLEKRIAEVPIESKELGYTKPGPYLYELLADLNITHKTASKLRDIVAVASTLLEEHNQQKSTGTVCRLDRIGEILDMVFRDGRTAHAKYYRVRIGLLLCPSYTTLDGFCLPCHFITTLCISYA